MELLLKITALCVAAAVIASLLGRSEGALSLACVLGAIVCAAALLAGVWGELSSLTKELMALTGLAPAVFAPLFKIMFIALTVRIGAAFCRDASQSALSSILETAGVFCALLSAAPLLSAVVELVEGWL